MKNTMYTVAALIAALAVVLSQRLIIPALILIFKAVEASFEPKEETLALDTTEEQTIAEPQAILNDEDADRAVKPTIKPTKQTKATATKRVTASTVAASAVVVTEEAPKPRRRRTRKTTVTA